jgi:hypothetical protein
MAKHFCLLISVLVTVAGCVSGRDGSDYEPPDMSRSSSSEPSRPASRAGATTCPTIGRDNAWHTVEEHLEWCSRDPGFNEGATCGYNALRGTELPGLPPLVGQPLLGNAWVRRDMMYLSRDAYRSGYRQQAVTAAVCCQVHTPDAHQCLQENHDAIARWFESK